MGRIAAIALLGTLFAGASAFAADAVDGSWKLNVAMSKFSGTAPKSSTRVYTDSADGTTLEQKTVGADGKEMSMQVTLKYDGKDHPITGNPDADSVAGKAIDAHTSHFTMKKGGKVVGTVHRVVSADGKTLTVTQSGTLNGAEVTSVQVFLRQP